MNSATRPFFERPALFVSTISPGYVAGGSQCALAFLQAFSELHQEEVTYIGPPYLQSAPPVDVSLRSMIEIGQRSRWSQIQDVMAFGSVDRTTAVACRHIEAMKETDAVVYVHGELAGRVVGAARSKGMTSVFISQNYAPEYLAAETRWFNIPRRVYCAVASRAAIAGYRDADICVTLTDEDREAYLRASGRKFDPSTIISRCYFGYDAPDVDCSDTASSQRSDEFTLLVNTNMALAQNIEGVLFLLRHVWPRVQDEMAWNLILAGRYPARSIVEEAAKCKRVEVVVRPEPREMEEIFQRSSVCVASTFKGSGIKLRVAEALRRGLPVLSTEHCSRGYEDISQDVLRIYRTADEFIAHAKSLAGMDRADVRKSAVQQYQQSLSFSAGIRKLSALAEADQRRELQHVG